MPSSASIPNPPEDVDGDGRWMDVHNRYVMEAKEKEPDVVFVGDSHIALLEQSELYKELFAPMHCLCFGIRGDSTANLLWRLQNGELECLKPRVVVVLIGSNNREMPDQVLEGIRTVVDLIHEKQPQASIFLLKIPPRGHKPNRKRELISQINEGLVKTVSHVSNCHVLDIDPGFVGSDGTISHRDMYDYLHLTNEGYRKAFETVYVAIQTIVNPDV